MTNQYQDPLDDILDRPIAYNPSFKRLTGRASAAVFLGQVWYWSKRCRNNDGWFYKSAKEWEEETGLTTKEQVTARKICKRLGLIEEKKKGVPATMYYRIVKTKIYSSLGFQFIPTGESADGINSVSPVKVELVSPDGVNFNKVTEITSKITSKRPLSDQEKEEVSATANEAMDKILEWEGKIEDSSKKGKSWDGRDAFLRASELHALIADQLILIFGKPMKSDLIILLQIVQNLVENKVLPPDIIQAGVLIKEWAHKPNTWNNESFQGLVKRLAISRGEPTRPEPEKNTSPMAKRLQNFTPRKKKE